MTQNHVLPRWVFHWETKKQRRLPKFIAILIAMVQDLTDKRRNYHKTSLEFGGYLSTYSCLRSLTSRAGMLQTAKEPVTNRLACCLAIHSDQCLGSIRRSLVSNGSLFRTAQSVGSTLARLLGNCAGNQVSKRCWGCPAKCKPGFGF